MTTYNLSTEQEERVKALLARNGDKTLNEKIYQLLDRGLSTMEREIKQRTTDRELKALGRLAQRDPNFNRPAPMVTITEVKRR